MMPVMKATKCSSCGNETFQGNLCVLCRKGITQLYKELLNLSKKDDNLVLRQQINMMERFRYISMN
jgi:hypothetical protein